jgi:uncharacterized membrane protein
MIAIIPNWHPILVHFTIALLAIATLLFVVSAVAGRGRAMPGVEAAANWNLWLGAALTALTIAAGLQAAGSVSHDDAAHLAMEDHKLWALSTAGLFMLLALWNALRVRRAQGVGIAFIALMLVALVGLAGTGLRGADLVFRHGLGVLSLPQVAGPSAGQSGGHEHDEGEEHSHDEPAAAADTGDGASNGGGGHAPAGAATAAPMTTPELSPAEAEVVAVLTAYHDALTAGDAAAPEQFVVADERFLMFEGKHVNQGWVEYRDQHLKGELGDLAQVRFRLSGYRVQIDGGLAAVSFIFNVLPKTGPEMDFGSGRATAVLLRTESGWKLQRLHTS